MVSAAVFFFSILDTSAKWLVQSLPLLQVVFLRFLGHTVFTAAVMVPNSRMNLLRTRRPWLQLLRALMMPGMTAMNFWALQYLQLAETGAIPQIVSHDGRGPHIHVSRQAAPMADRITAHLAMGLAELLVSGESGRLRSCASPTCRDVFLDESRNRSRRYCDSRTCGNRLHVAAYRARKAAAG